MKCETYMNFEKVEKPAEGSLGVFFACPSCGARFTMVTNPGETQMVSSLGVQLGGRTAAPPPFQMTRRGPRAEGEGQAEMANYRSEERRVGKEGRSRGAPEHLKKKTKENSNHAIAGEVVSFFFQAEDGIRDLTVTGVQTCALPISSRWSPTPARPRWSARWAYSSAGAPPPPSPSR